MKGTLIPSMGEPLWRVNMDLAPRRWDCEPWQMLMHRNPSRANSAWLGTVTNFLNLPTRYANEVVFPVSRGDLVGALVMMFGIPITTLALTVAGLIGRLHCLPADPGVISRARMATPEEVAADAATGERAFLLPVGPVL